MVGWRTLYFKPGVYKDNPKQSKEWNRGAYLVEGLGHCNACHSARNALGAISADDEYAGGLIPVQNWYAPSLTSNRETGLGEWDIKEIVDLLRTGVSTRGAVYGPMSAVVQHSLQETSLTDLSAMATYLKSHRADQRSRPTMPQAKTTVAQTDAMLASGAKLYEKHCADCHQPEGEGVPRIYPPLANNQSIAMPFPINAIRIVLNGGFPPSTEGNPRPYGMPPFAYELSDDEVAAVVTYIRQSWGNRAPPLRRSKSRAAGACRSTEAGVPRRRRGVLRKGAPPWGGPAAASGAAGVTLGPTRISPMCSRSTSSAWNCASSGPSASRAETMPIGLPFSTTGTWRKPPSNIMCSA